MNWNVKGTGSWKGDLQLGFVLYLIFMAVLFAIAFGIYGIVEVFS